MATKPPVWMARIKVAQRPHRRPDNAGFARAPSFPGIIISATDHPDSEGPRAIRDISAWFERFLGSSLPPSSPPMSSAV